MTYIVKIMPKAAITAAEPSRHLDAVLAYDGVSTFELGIAVEIFGLTSMGPNWYRVLVCSDRRYRRMAASTSSQAMGSSPSSDDLRV
jgi:AraC family transcriptional activator FtrA